ncbi:uncharacterized protein LOC120326815 isoform X2 [Styela clava]
MTICGIPGCNYVRKTGGRSMFRIRRPDLARTPGERKHRQRLTNVMLSIRDFTKGDNIKDLIHKEACCICDNHFAKEDILDYGMKMSLRLGAMPTKNMPFPQCSVPGCHHPNGFRFPKRMRIKKKWIEAINRAGDFGKRKWKPNSKSNVCYQHFLKEDFCCDESGKILKMLKSTAVPSIFNTYDPELNSVKFKIKEAPLKATMKPKTAQEIMLSLPISSVSQDGEQAYVNNVVMGLTGDTQGPDMVEKLFVTNIRGSDEMPMHNTGMTETTNLKNADSFEMTGDENTKSDSNSEQEPSNTNSLSAIYSLHKTVERIPTDKKNGVNENQMVFAKPYLDTTQHEDGGLGNNFERNMDPMPPTSSRKDTYPSLNSTNASNINESWLENGNLISDCETNLSKESVKYLPGNNDVSNSQGLPLTDGLRVENQMEGSLSSNCETSVNQTSLIYSPENTVILNSSRHSINNPTDLIKAPYNPSIQQSHNEANIDRMDIAEENTLNSKLNILADKNVSSVTTQEIEMKKGEESLLVSELETTCNKTIQFASADENSECATLEILLENAAMEIDQTKLRVTNGQAVNNEIRKQSSLSTQAKTNFGKNIEMVDCSETIIEKENSTLDALKISKEFKFGESPQSDQKRDQQNFASVPHKYSGASALIVNGTPLKKGNLLVQQTLCKVASTNFKLNKQKTNENSSGKKTVNERLDDATLISLRKRTVQKPQCAEKFDKSQAYSVGHEIKEYSALLKKVSMDNGDLVSSDNSGLVSPHTAEDPCVLMPIPRTDPQIYLPKNFLYSFLLANEISEKECILQRLESLGGDMRTLTGFDSYEHFDLFFNMLGPLALEMTSKALKSREQLFLVLVKLSGAKSDIEISKALKIGPTSVRIIFERWEEFMLNQLQSVLGTQKTEWMSGM